jgi:hypothetical protein
MTPERLDAIRADVADVERRAGRIAAWRAMPHPFAVESGLRTQGLRAPRLAADLRDLLAEVGRLQAAKCAHPGVAMCAREWESRHQRLALEYHGLAERFPFGCDAIDHVCDALLGAEEQVMRLQAEVMRLQAERDAAYRAGQEAMRSRTP